MTLFTKYIKTLFSRWCMFTARNFRPSTIFSTMEVILCHIHKFFFFPNVQFIDFMRTQCKRFLNFALVWNHFLSLQLWLSILVLYQLSIINVWIIYFCVFFYLMFIFSLILSKFWYFLSGCCHRKPLLVPGGRAFVWPGIQYVQR